MTPAACRLGRRLVLGAVRSPLTLAPAPRRTRGSSASAPIRAAERSFDLPAGLLMAVALTETGRQIGDVLTPWPWSINAAGEGAWLEHRRAAIERTRALQASGVESIDVGCMQVNLKWHEAAFDSLWNLRSIRSTNVTYAATPPERAARPLARLAGGRRPLPFRRSGPGTPLSGAPEPQLERRARRPRRQPHAAAAGAGPDPAGLLSAAARRLGPLVDLTAASRPAAAPRHPPPPAAGAWCRRMVRGPRGHDQSPRRLLRGPDLLQSDRHGGARAHGRDRHDDPADPGLAGRCRPDAVLRARHPDLHGDPVHRAAARLLRLPDRAAGLAAPAPRRSTSPRPS